MNSIAESYLTHFQLSWSERKSWAGASFVIVDTESTGLDPKRDKVISMGGLVIRHGEICLEESFEVIIPVAYNTSSVTIHGITREASEAGVDEPVALEQFLDFLRDGIIVGHHIDHDIAMINRACNEHFGLSLKNLSVDIMDLTLRLEQAGMLRDREQIETFGLDGLCAYFHVTPHDRHTASGDAFITAQIFLKLLRLARSAGWTRLGDLMARFVRPAND